MNFLVQSPHGWRGIRQRPHHLMTRFAALGHRVQWVESRYLRWLIDRRRDFMQARHEAPVPGLEVAPVTLLNGERLAPVRRWNEARLARALNSNNLNNENGARILWIYNPHESFLADRVPHDLLIYDIMDDYPSFPWAPPNIVEEENALLKRANWVFAGTEALAAAKGPLAAGKLECLLSGVDTALFRKPAENLTINVPLPVDEANAELQQRYRHLVGYAGMLDLRLDQGALLEAARRHPDIGFVLIGPEATDLSALNAAKNIHRLGARPYETLPHYYHAWDAAIIPFVDNAVTRHVNPTKMLEYAAAGLPIVCRDLPELRKCYGDGAWLYATPEEFSQQMGRALDLSEPTRAARLAAAESWTRERSWDAIAERMLARVEDLLRAKKITAVDLLEK